MIQRLRTNKEKLYYTNASNGSSRHVNDTLKREYPAMSTRTKVQTFTVTQFANRDNMANSDSTHKQDTRMPNR